MNATTLHVGRRADARWRRSIAALEGGVRRVYRLLRLWRRRRVDRRELARLDERTLRDIGLTIGDAEFLINKPFWRE